MKKTVVGKAGAGGKAAWHSDSMQDEAVAEIEGTGKATVKLTTTKTDNDAVDKSVAIEILNGKAARSVATDPVRRSPK